MEINIFKKGKEVPNWCRGRWKNEIFRNRNHHVLSSLGGLGAEGGDIGGDGDLILLLRCGDSVEIHSDNVGCSRSHGVGWWRSKTTMWD